MTNNTTVYDGTISTDHAYTLFDANDVTNVGVQPLLNWRETLLAPSPMRILKKTVDNRRSKNKTARKERRRQRKRK